MVDDSDFSGTQRADNIKIDPNRTLARNGCLLGTFPCEGVFLFCLFFWVGVFFQFNDDLQNNFKTPLLWVFLNLKYAHIRYLHHEINKSFLKT